MPANDDDTLLEFPCEFPIKVMGRDEAGFRRAAVALIEAHTGKVSDEMIRTSSSSKGNFLSITVTITAESRAQLDDIYRSLSASEDILVAL